VILVNIWILLVTFIVTKIEGKSLALPILSEFEVKCPGTFRNRFKFYKLITYFQVSGVGFNGNVKIVIPSNFKDRYRQRRYLVLDDHIAFLAFFIPPLFQVIEAVCLG
jgi:hypothetical protein